MTRKNMAAAILIMIAAGLWGTMPVPIRKAAYDPLWTAWVRFVGNALILTFFFRHSLKKFGRPTLIEVGIATAFFLSLLTYTVGMKLTSAANAVIFGFTSPFAGLLVEVITGRRPTWKEVGLMAALVVGVVVLNGGFTALRVGDLLALASGILWGGFFPKAQSLKERFQVTVLWQQLLGVLIIPLVALVQTGNALPPAVSLPQFGWLTLLVTVGGVAYVMHVKATQTDSVAPHVNLSLQVFQAITASILGYFALGESFGWNKGIGATIILIAAYHLVRRSEHS